MKLELYHLIPDPASAAARRRVVELGLVEIVSFRNTNSERNQAALEAHGGKDVPALFDGEKLHEGEAAVLAALEAAARLDRKRV